jgi:hypothetical protein
MGGLLTGLAAVALAIWLRWPQPPEPEEPAGDVKASGQGWKIRYNANVSLAAIGSNQVRLDLLREMLDEPKQLKNFRAKLKDDKNVPDENGARSAILTTLKAIVAWHEKLDVRRAYQSRQEDLRKVYAAIERLAAKSPSIVVRQEAQRTLRSIGVGS